MEILGKILVAMFGTHANIATVLISMVPIIELKGAMPIGMSADLWGVHALSGSEAFWLALLGSCLVVPIIALTFTPLLKWFKTITEKAEAHEKNPRIWLRCLLLMLFVAVPLPLTGMWTGTCVGVVIGLKFWQIMLTVITGNIIAALIIYFVLAIFPALTTILALAFLIIAIIIVAYLLYKVFTHKEKKEI